MKSPPAQTRKPPEKASAVKIGIFVTNLFRIIHTKRTDRCDLFQNMKNQEVYRAYGEKGIDGFVFKRNDGKFIVKMIDLNAGVTLPTVKVFNPDQEQEAVQYAQNTVGCILHPNIGLNA